MVKVDLTFIDSVLDKHGHSKTKAIAIMQDVQNEYKFLPKDALSYIAEKLGMSEAELYGVATFYENFSMNEKGKYVIKVCNGTACIPTARVVTKTPAKNLFFMFLYSPILLCKTHITLQYILEVLHLSYSILQ